MKYTFSVIIEKDEDGYFASAPELQGCYTQGTTYEEALANIRDVIALHVQDRRERGEDIPGGEEGRVVNLASIEVAV